MKEKEKRQTSIELVQTYDINLAKVNDKYNTFDGSRRVLALFHWKNGKHLNGTWVFLIFSFDLVRFVCVFHAEV